MSRCRSPQPTVLVDVIFEVLVFQIVLLAVRVLIILPAQLMNQKVRRQWDWCKRADAGDRMPAIRNGTRSPAVLLVVVRCAIFATKTKREISNSSLEGADSPE